VMTGSNCSGSFALDGMVRHVSRMAGAQAQHASEYTAHLLLLQWPDRAIHRVLTSAWRRTCPAPAAQ
jgi:hypothetical protein